MGADAFDAIQVGHGARHSQGSMTSPGRQAKSRDRGFQQAVLPFTECASSLQRGDLDLRIQASTPPLHVSRGSDPRRNGCRILAMSGGSPQRGVVDRPDRHVQVDAIDERAGKPRQIALDLRR